MKNTKILVINIIVLLTLTASQCEKENNNCHYTITVRNDSKEDVISSVPIYGESGCRLDGSILKKGEVDIYDPFGSCIEGRLESSQFIVICIVDPENFNAPNYYYNCDSIPFKNIILKKYRLTLDTLKQINFNLIYSD